MMKNFLSTILLFAWTCLAAVAQDSEYDIVLNVNGSAEDYNGIKLEAVAVEVYMGNKLLTELSTSTSGKFEFDLEMDTLYEVKFIKEGFVTKKIGFDTRSVPEEDKKFGDYSISKLRIRMVTQYDDIDYSVMRNQAGRYVYSNIDGSFIPDERYAKRMKHTFSTIEKKLEQKKKDQILLEKEFTEEYEMAIRDADLFYEEKDYESAYWQYQAASELKPSESYPHDQMVKVERKMKATEEDDAAYVKFMEEGNDLVRDGAYRGAIAKFEEAADIKPDETYPEERITYCEDMLNAQTDEERQRLLALQAEEQKQKEFKELMEKGHDLVTLKMYMQAESAYLAAAELIPSKTEPAEAIAQIEMMLAEQKAEFERLNLEAQVALKDKEFDLAQAKISAALRIWPDNEEAKELSKTIDSEEYKEEERLRALALKGANDTVYNTKLAEEYPEGKTETKENFPDREEVTIVIVEGNRGDKYVLKNYKTGKDFFLKNEQPYDQKRWLQETGYTYP